MCRLVGDLTGEKAKGGEERATFQKVLGEEGSERERDFLEVESWFFHTTTTFCRRTGFETFLSKVKGRRGQGIF